MAPFFRLGAFLVENDQAALQRLAEARLFELERLGDQRLGADQFRIGLAHLAGQRRHQLPHQRLFGPQQFGVAHGAPHDPAQHIAAAFVRGQHAIGDQKRGGAQVIGDHPVRGLLRAVGGNAGEIGDGADQRHEQVDAVIVVGALQHRGDALKPHAGVDRRPRQVGALAGGQLLVLHEHEIPDFDEAVAVGVRASRAGRREYGRRGRRRFPSRARTGRCRPWPRNYPSRRCAGILLSGRPAIFFHSLKASSSSI